MQLLSPAAIQAPISLLEKTPALLEILLRDRPPGHPGLETRGGALVHHGSPGAHMVEIEKLYEQRTHRIVLEDAPTLSKYESCRKRNQMKSIREYMEEFVPLRRAFVFYLHSIPASAGGRTGRHVELGTIRLSQMLHELANHDLGHLRQIAELYRAKAFHPYAGPFQKYSNPKP